jgi:hypothetical protein
MNLILLNCLKYTFSQVEHLSVAVKKLSVLFKGWVI